MADFPDSLPSISIEAYLAEALSTDLILTAGNRLSREISSRFATVAGTGAALLPRVLPYAKWLRQCWQELHFQSILGGDDDVAGALLLSEAQEEMLWERVLRESGAAAHTLFLDDTVQACARSASLLDQYRVPLDDEAWQRDEECLGFHAWYQLLREECRARRFVRVSRLPAFLTKRMERVPALAAGRLLLAGFEELSPAQRALLEAAARASRGALVLESRDDAAAVPEAILRGADAEEELRAAAVWARDRLAEDAQASLAVVVPDLAARRSLVLEIFGECFGHGQSPAPGTEDTSPFHVSLGTSLLATPVARALFAMMPLLLKRAVLADARALLRSPYVARAAAEREARSKLEAILHRERRDDITLERLRHAAVEVEARTGASLAHWKSALLAMERLDVRGEQPPSVWTARLRTLCAECLWLGEPTLSGAEFQTRHRALEELGEMAELDPVAGMIEFSAFVRLLRRRFEAATFQPETSPKPLLVAGLFEVTGLRFDAVWVCGLTDAVLPRPLQADPFIPRKLQRAHGLPRCESARERAFAIRSFERMLRLAPRMIFSFPAREKQEELEPSPLLRALAERHGTGIAALNLPPARQALAAPRMEQREDWQAGALPEGHKRVQRGSQVLADQSACPFRAFARTRLGSEAELPEQPGMNRMDQGQFVHKALELFWRSTKTQDALLALDARALDERLAQCVAEALEGFRAGFGDALAEAQRDAERIRLTQLLHGWIEHELSRQPFAVVETEKRHKVDLGSMELQIRPDRIDRLADGSLALIDYKTGIVKRSMWDGERPEQPQLLLYLAAEERPVSTIAFASLKAGKTAWELYGANVPEQFSASKKEAIPAEGWEAFVERSREAVARLTQQFREGFAPVDPLHGKETCKYCDQQPFCRIAEWAAGSGEGEAEEA